MGLEQFVPFGEREREAAEVGDVEVVDEDAEDGLGDEQSGEEGAEQADEEGEAEAFDLFGAKPVEEQGGADGGGVGIGYSLHAGQVTVADGSDLMAKRIERVLNTDPGMGVIRHADAGYEEAQEFAKKNGVKIPMSS